MSQTESKRKIINAILFLISLAVLVVCANTLTIQFAYIAHNWMALNILLPIILLIGSFFYIIWYVSPSLPFNTSSGFIVGVCGVFMLIFASAYLTANADKLRDMTVFKKKNLLDAQSKEFGIVRAIGRDHNVLIRLGNTKNSWAMSRLNLPNSSGASITLENAHCKLNYNGDSVQDMTNAVAVNLPGVKTDIDIPKLMIMVHELAHCLDIKRDFATFNLDRVDPKYPQNIVIGTHAIAPQFRSAILVNDVETYYVEAGKSVLWKEAFADVYSIGFLYVQYPKIASSVTQNLISFRAKYASKDPTHDTTCWLANIENTVKPENVNELIEWSDKIRNNSDCTKKMYAN